MPPLINKKEMNTVDSGDQSEDEHMSTEILEDIRDSSQSHLSIIGERYVIKYAIALNKDNWNIRQRYYLR